MKPVIRNDRTNIQIALDFGDSRTLLRIAARVQEHVDWIEVGTPWLMAEGVAAVRKVRRAFPKHVVVADLKIVDAGDHESRLGFAAGADIVTVLGSASDETIREAIHAAEENNGLVMVDLLNVLDPAGRARQVMGLGADLVVIHAGYDDLLAGKGGHTGLAAAGEAAPGATVVGGGIGPNNVAQICRYRPAAIIVGRAITASNDPVGTARQIRQNADRGWEGLP